MRIAFVHDWLTVYSGAERVLEQMIQIYPDCDVFSTVDFLPKDQRYFLKGKSTHVTFIQKLPFAKKFYRSYLPLMPLAIEQLDLTKYDLIISSSHAVAKGVITGPGQLHVCMCYSPMRYAWDLKFQYLNVDSKKFKLKRILQVYFLHRLKQWDFTSAQGVDQFIAISHFIKKRIQKCYRRDAVVIYPPVKLLERQLKGTSERKNYFITHSRLVPYKKIDLIIEAFNKYLPDKKLKIIGAGPEEKKLKKLAQENIEFLGFVNNEVLMDELSHAKGYIFAAEEDFGIAPLEAQGLGTPVIAYGKGGSVETIGGFAGEGKCGILFYEHTASSLAAAINEFTENIEEYTPEACHNNAMRFSEKNFQIQFQSFIDKKIKESKTS